MCFNSQLHDCRGACNGLESAESYNQRVNKSIYPLNYRSPNFFIIDQGRIKEEQAVIEISNGRYTGFGYISMDCTPINLEIMKDCIRRYADNRDIRTIIKGYINRNKFLKIIEF